MPAFTSFAFAATGAPISRTMPDRLGLDGVNVKDWGAIGDGIHNDSTAIQAAILYAYSLRVDTNHGGAILFFPPGLYNCYGTAINVDNTNASGPQGGLSLVGVGKDVSIIKGNVSNQYLLYRVYSGGSTASNVNYIADLTIENDAATSGGPDFGPGALDLNSDNSQTVCIKNVHFVGYVGAKLDIDTFGHQFSDCVFTCSGSKPTGSVGCYMGQGQMVNCKFSGFDNGLALSGVGHRIIGNQISGCNIGIYCGLGGIGSTTNGSEIISNHVTNCSTEGIHVQHAEGVVIAANVFSGNGTDIAVQGDSVSCVYVANVMNSSSGVNFNAASYTGQTVFNSVCMAMEGPNGWGLPSTGDRRTAASWQFISCGLPTHSPPTPFMHFGDLPGQGVVQQILMEGAEYTITDADTQASFGGVVVHTTGANHYKVRWNGTNWIRTG